MAKAADSRKFRTVDVDKYTGEQYEEEPDEGAEDAGPSEAEVVSLLNRGDHLGALRVVLQKAPRKSKNIKVKQMARQLVMQVLAQTKSSDIQKAVDALSNDELDTLMKYIYKGFEAPDPANAAQLLGWHEKVLAKVGLGCIVRVLADTKGI